VWKFITEGIEEFLLSSEEHINPTDIQFVNKWNIFTKLKFVNNFSNRIQLLINELELLIQSNFQLYAIYSR